MKDLVDVAGLPTTAGFKPFGAPIPLRDAAIVTRLKAAGAIILAKVATVNWFGKGFDETHPIGPSLNPYNLAYSPGGSSNGVGVSLAAWFAAAGIGTDTGGSVRGPSAYGSLAGLLGTRAWSAARESSRAAPPRTAPARWGAMSMTSPSFFPTFRVGTRRTS